MKGRIGMDGTAGVPAASSGDTLLRAVLSTAVDQAIVAINTRCRVTLANRGVEQLLGWPAADLVGRHLRTLVPPDTPPFDFGTVLSSDCVREGSRLRTLVRADGGLLPVLVSVGILHDEAGTPSGAVLVAGEVHTDRRAEEAIRQAFAREHSAAERLREVNRIKDDFVANVSHELRTPLTTVVGNTEMLLDGDAGELTRPQRRLLDAVERNAHRLQRLVGDLLMLSRIQAGKLHGDTTTVVLQDVVQEAVRAVGGSGPRVEVLLPAVPLVVDGDADDLARMVGNVVGNAVKFTPADGTVTVRVAERDGRARIEVGDTGIGIPDEELSAVFEGFFRSSRSRVNETPGTGLGLTIARSIADRHSGTIDISHREPVGTTVTIELPLVPTEAG